MIKVVGVSQRNR